MRILLTIIVINENYRARTFPFGDCFGVTLLPCCKIWRIEANLLTIFIEELKL
jgi:hypothetical protein